MARPRVDKEVDPEALPIKWATPNPPRHGGHETLVRLDYNAPEALYIDGVWVSPGEIAWVRSATAKRNPELKTHA